MRFTSLGFIGLVWLSLTQHSAEQHVTPGASFVQPAASSAAQCRPVPSSPARPRLTRSGTARRTGMARRIPRRPGSARRAAHWTVPVLITGWPQPATSGRLSRMETCQPGLLAPRNCLHGHWSSCDIYNLTPIKTEGYVSLTLIIADNCIITKR